MAYDRNDPYRGDRLQGDDRSSRSGRSDSYRRDSSGPDTPRRENAERGFFDRAGDEISSWFGDEEAERRREQDDRSNGGARGERGWRGQEHARNKDRDHDGGGLFGMGSRRNEDEGRGDSSRFQSHRSNGADSPDYGAKDQAQGGERNQYRPYAGDYGRSSAERGERSDAGAGSSMSGARAIAAAYGAGQDRSPTQSHDPHYAEWRQRQIDQLDADYEDYRREHQSKFDNDFSGWRGQRQSKRQMLGQVREHMEVFGSDEQSVGVVDKVQGDRIILTKDSQGGVHKSLGCTAIDRIEGDRLMLAHPADEAKRQLVEERSFEERNTRDQRDQNGPGGSNGPHNLERSFSGTYR